MRNILYRMYNITVFINIRKGIVYSIHTKVTDTVPSQKKNTYLTYLSTCVMTRNICQKNVLI